MQSKVLATEISHGNLFHFIIGLLMVECIAFLSSQICVVPFSFLSGNNIRLAHDTVNSLCRLWVILSSWHAAFDSAFIVYKATLFHGHL